MYLTFAVSYAIDYLYPSVTNAAMFTQYLANSFSSPLSIKNTISGAKTWINNHYGNSQAFDSQPVRELLKKLTSMSNHQPMPALPITDTELHIIISYIDSQPVVPIAVKPCILLTFACMFRSSNVLSPSLSQWGGAHTLSVSNIIVNDFGLLINIPSTKTFGPSNPHVLQIYPSQAPRLCPVRAWIAYLAAIKPPWTGPAFLLNNRRPLTAAPVVTALRSALASAGYDDCNRYSMHSFRRGAVQFAERLGVSHEDIMQHGLWRSKSGLNHYTKTVSPAVAQALARGLAH